MGKKNFINLALFATIGLLSLDAFANVKTCVHGNSAQFETPDRAGTVLYKGWGIDFGKSGVSNWIHYSIPVRDPNLKLKSLSIKFYLGSHDIFNTLGLEPKVNGLDATIPTELARPS